MLKDRILIVNGDPGAISIGHTVVQCSSVDRTVSPPRGWDDVSMDGLALGITIDIGDQIVKVSGDILVWP